MKNLSYALFVLTLAGCTVNGKSLFGLGSTAPGTSMTSPVAAGSPRGEALAPRAPNAVNVTSPVVQGPAPRGYAWCKDVPDDNQWDDVKDIFSGTENVDRVLPTIATVLCHPDSDPAHPSVKQRDQIEAARQAWLAKLGMTEAEWATDYMQWHAIPFAQRNASHVPWSKEKLAWSTMGAIDQFAYIQQDTGLAGPFTLNGYVSKAYVADAMQLTEAGRLGYIAVCLHETNPVVWATCQSDIEAFDRNKYVAEIRADKSRSGADKMWLRFELATLDEEFAQHAARVKDVVAKDPAYARLFEIGKATHAQWKTKSAFRAELLALVASLDDARETGSRKALAGCEAKTSAMLGKAIAAMPGTSFDGIQSDAASGVSFTENALGVLLGSPEMYLAANARVACGGEAESLVHVLAGALPTWTGFRGPRTATLTAIRLANLELDARGEELAVPDATLPLAIERLQGRDGRSAASVIANVETTGDSVTVEFPKTSRLDSHCTRWRVTNRITRIGSDGTVYYQQECLGWVPERTNTTIKPITVAKRHAAGLAPGRHVSIVGDVPEAVWAKAGAAHPIAVFGVLLK